MSHPFGLGVVFTPTSDNSACLRLFMRDREANVSESARKGYHLDLKLDTRLQNSPSSLDATVFVGSEARNQLEQGQ